MKDANEKHRGGVRWQVPKEKFWNAHGVQEKVLKNACTGKNGRCALGREEGKERHVTRGGPKKGLLPGPREMVWKLISPKVRRWLVQTRKENAANNP